MQFHQIEGLYIDRDVSFADLKKVLYDFATYLFGPAVQIRFRPSYFPFTEPSAEMDVTCFLCSGSGCGVCKHSGWVEILGCGMVDPQVLENCGIDADVYSGYAFGIGIERLTMLRHRIPDIRLFYENDLRFVRQFGHAG
jgi:phenylalanyl-tRNA synthetase alpha chain